MKKIAFLSALLLAVTLGSQAQNYRYGAKGGVTFATISGMENINGRAGLHGGIQFMYGVYQPLALQVELLYNARGYETSATTLATPTAPGGMATYQFRNRFHYLDLPLLFRYKFGRIFVEAGPQASFLFRARHVQIVKFDTPEGEQIQQTDTDTLPILRKLDYSLAGGLGFAINNSLEVSARYNHGLRTPWKPNQTGGPTGKDNRVNSWFQVSLNYYIPNFSQQPARPGLGL